MNSSAGANVEILPVGSGPRLLRVEGNTSHSGPTTSWYDLLSGIPGLRFAWVPAHSRSLPWCAKMSHFSELRPMHVPCLAAYFLRWKQSRP